MKTSQVNYVRNGLMGFVFLCLAMSTSFAQTTLNVPSVSFPTIQSAINLANANDTIVVAPGTYFENLNFPNVDMHVIGAGQGLTIIDGGSAGACLTFRHLVSNAMIVEGMTLQNGSGASILDSAGNPKTAGGGIFVASIGGFTAIISPTFKDLEIVSCKADFGPAVSVRNAGNVRIEDCDIHNNGDLTQANLEALEFRSNIFVSLKRTLIRNHDLPSGLGTIRFDQSIGEIDGCEIRDNSCFSLGAIYTAGFGFNMTIRNTAFINNTTLDFGGYLIGPILYAPLTIDNCLFAKNTGGVHLFTVDGGTVRNCTVTDNVLQAGATVAIPLVNPARIENSIMNNNRDSLGNVVRGAGDFLMGGITLINSIHETPANSATFVHPTYLDPVNNDYRLAPGSIGVDGGTTTGLVPAFVNTPIPQDLSNNPRVRYGAIDIGCYEAQDVAYDSSANGRVGIAAGGPYDVLQINGSSGGFLRTVKVLQGSSSSVSMIQPPNLPNSAGFAIFGLLAEANELSLTNVPLGIGPMTFPPCPMFPSHPLLLTLTNNLGTICPPLVASTPTPWTSAPFPPIFFPLALTFQGIIEEAPGVYVPTNMVIFKVE